MLQPFTWGAQNPSRVQYIILLAIGIINIIIILPCDSPHRDISSQVTQMELMAFAVHMTFYQELIYSVFWKTQKAWFLLLIPTILLACGSKMKVVSYSLSEGKSELMNGNCKFLQLSLFILDNRQWRT